MSGRASQPISQLLADAASGDPAQAVFPFVYDELRKIASRQMAKEPPGLTLQTTALLHEAYLRLIGDEPIAWNSRGHFYSAAAQAMRRILVERARRYARFKHGGGRQRASVDLDSLTDGGSIDCRAEEVLALDDALDALESLDRRKWSVVLLRFFAGLSVAETARSLGVSEPTVKNDWRFAKSWLAVEMGG